MQDILEKLPRINKYSTQDQLQPLVEAIAANSSDSALRGALSPLLKEEREEPQYHMNVLAAGLFGIIPGSKYMFATQDGAYVVNPFLHNLRKAALSAPSLRDRLRANARKYVFYTEFLSVAWTLPLRIAAIAKAHAGADIGNDLLPVLYSLGGFFSYAESDTGLRGAKQSGGTTCVMTARAIYHAAGASMIGDRDPTVNTPAVPNSNSGVPSTKVDSKGNRFGSATLLRDDQQLFGAHGYKGADANEANRPRLSTGDIYYVDGAGEHKFLLRAGAVAAHVGIIVEQRGLTRVDTIDGGSGQGAKIDLNLNREIKHVPHLGWTLDKPGRSFTSGNIAEAEAYMQQFKDDAAVVDWMKKNPKLGAASLRLYEKYNTDIQRNASNAALVKQLEKGRNQVVAGVRGLIRQMKKDSTSIGQDRVLRGWWKPEQYSELRYAGVETLKSLLST